MAIGVESEGVELVPVAETHEERDQPGRQQQCAETCPPPERHGLGTTSQLSARPTTHITAKPATRGTGGS